MKRLFYLLTFLIALSSPAWAQYAPVWRIEEVDGSPQVINPTVVKVSNGTLSCTGRVCTITTGGGGGGSPGGSIGAELFHPISKSGKLQLHLESSLTFFGFKQNGFADRLWAAQLRNSVGIAYFPNYEKE